MHPLGRQDLLAAGQVGQPRRAVHRVAVAVAADLHHVARVDADLHLHRCAARPRVHRLLAQAALDRDARLDRIAFGRKDDEQAVPEQLHHVPAVPLEGLADGGRELHDEAAGGLVAEPLEQAGAAHQVREYDCGHVLVLEFSAARGRAPQPILAGRAGVAPKQTGSCIAAGAR